MNVDAIIKDIDIEIAKLQQVRQALAGTSTQAKRGRPKGSSKKGGMTAAGRKRISDAMKARWAAKKKSK